MPDQLNSELEPASQTTDEVPQELSTPRVEETSLPVVDTSKIQPQWIDSAAKIPDNELASNAPYFVDAQQEYFSGQAQSIFISTGKVDGRSAQDLSDAVKMFAEQHQKLNPAYEQKWGGQSGLDEVQAFIDDARRQAAQAALEDLMEQRGESELTVEDLRNDLLVEAGIAEADLTTPDILVEKIADKLPLEDLLKELAEQKVVKHLRKLAPSQAFTNQWIRRVVRDRQKIDKIHMPGMLDLMFQTRGGGSSFIEGGEMGLLLEQKTKDDPTISEVMTILADEDAKEKFLAMFLSDDSKAEKVSEIEDPDKKLESMVQVFMSNEEDKKKSIKKKLLTSIQDAQKKLGKATALTEETIVFSQELVQMMYGAVKDTKPVKK